MLKINSYQLMLIL